MENQDFTDENYQEQDDGNGYGGEEDEYGDEQDQSYGQEDHGQAGYDEHDPSHGQHGEDHDMGEEEGGEGDGSMNEDIKKSLDNLLKFIFRQKSQTTDHKPHPDHAHTRFAMDPHHRDAMQSFHKVAG